MFEAMAVIVVAVFLVVGWRLVFRGESVGWVRCDRDRLGASAKVVILVKRHATRRPKEPEIDVQLRVAGAARATTLSVEEALEAARMLDEAASTLRRRLSP